MLRKFVQLAAWLSLSIIILLSIVPPAARPTTGLPHGIEHAAIFLMGGMLFGASDLGRQWTLSIYALTLCAALEMMQLFIPGRHARLSDFIVDVSIAIMGIFLGDKIIRPLLFAAFASLAPKRLKKLIWEA
jgi:VanZ family protein